MKICYKCHVSKSLEDFNRLVGSKDGYQAKCRLCETEYCQENKIKIAVRSKKYRSANKEKLSLSGAHYYYQNREKILLRQKNYYQDNKKKKLIYIKNKKLTDPQYRISLQLRTRLNMALRSKAKKGSAVKDLGCSIEELIKHLESQFQEGMNWDNYGKWHLDHIQPLASFNLENREEFLKACHYSNLQPLWAEDNFRKGSKIVESRYPNYRNVVKSTICNSFCERTRD